MTQLFAQPTNSAKNANSQFQNGGETAKMMQSIGQIVKLIGSFL